MYVSDSKSGSEGIIIISDCNSCNISSLDKYFLTLLLLPLLTPLTPYSFSSSWSLEWENIYIYFRVSFSLKEYPILIKFHFILTPFPPSNIEHWMVYGLQFNGSRAEPEIEITFINLYFSSIDRNCSFRFFFLHYTFYHHHRILCHYGVK